MVGEVEAIDIWQTAKILIGRYGARARLEAAWLASVGYQSGIPNSVHVWKRVAEAIEQLQRAQQPGEARSGQRRNDDV